MLSIPEHLRRPAPKDLRQNIAYRREWLALAAGDEAIQEYCWIRCKRDPIWYCDTFLWTYDPKKYRKAPRRPLILYDFQEEALKKILDALGVHDLIFKKSRDMGATTLALVGLEHPAHFCELQTFLLVSRNQDAVDKKNDSDSLFWKLDFMIANQPNWLRPRCQRQSLSLLFDDTKSAFIGASTTGEAGRGGRKVADLLDEFAAVPSGEDRAMLAATRDATNCRLINSTPRGAAGAYADQLEKYQRVHPEWVITMHWTQHPIKRMGLYYVHVDDARNPTVDIVDKEWHAAHPDYKFVTSGTFFWNHKARSPWYDLECDRTASPQEIAQELDMEMAESESQYFDASVLARLREKYSRQPDHRGEIVWDGNDFKSARWDETANGRVMLWTRDSNGKDWFDPDKQFPFSDITIGCDVATGKGGDMSSNSVASMVRASTGEKIGEFAVNTLSAFEFCEYVIAMCHWMNGAFLIYEDIGPGGEFTRRLRDGVIYSNVFRDDAEDRSLSRKKTKRLGFAPTPRKKQSLLADYRSALASGKFINHSDPALVECGEYIVLVNGTIEHSRAAVAQDPHARGKNHGDRVIADALAHRGILDKGTYIEPEKPTVVPVGSALWRRQEREKRQDEWELAEVW